MITNQLKETQRNYLMETAKVLFPKKKGCESSAAYRNVVRAADILFMVTENISRKLVSRCAAAAMALIITIAGMGASSAGTSDSAVAAQEVQTSAVETTTTQQTVAYSMSTYKASQGAYSGSAYNVEAAGNNIRNNNGSYYRKECSNYKGCRCYKECCQDNCSSKETGIHSCSYCKAGSNNSSRNDHST